ncbi:T9SS type A sorting domain-containing protein [candidate division WOR-3 bacterium]|nr:T9SS type A sorting domain-containing protein [candidate division WOR-3 bacterium]
MGYALVLAALAVMIPAAQVDQTGEPGIATVVAEHGQTLADFVDLAPLYVQHDVDPGIPAEGDYLDRPVFTRDGSKVIVSNRMTGNITVFDWATMAAETTVDVGSYPAGMAVTDSLLVICRPFADSVSIVRLSDWAVVARLPSGVQPWVVHSSPDQQKAYVGCDISNTLEVYDLATLEHTATFSDFPFYLVTVSWNSENGRFYGQFSDFEVTPDGSHIIAPDTAPQLLWVNAATGVKDDTLAGIGKCWFVRYSGDNTKLITANYDNPCKVWQIDVATHAVTDSVVITGYTLSTVDAAVNMDGSKAYLGTSNNTSTLVKFETGDFVTFSQTYTAFWLGVSPDHSKAIGGQYRFSVVDFASEQLLGQHQGNAQYFGAVSPVGSRVASFDPQRHEGVYFYDYTNSAPTYRGTTISGEAPEGDAPHRVKLSPDGSTAISTNVLSDNLSIIDVPSALVETILPLGDRPQDIAFTSDSRWAVVCGMNGNDVGIVDLNGNSITEVPVGTAPATVVITPNDSFAYVGNISSNTISVVQLDGASSQVIATIPCGEIGIVWGSYGIWSGLGMSPSGRYCLVAVSFEDLVRVIDVATNQVVAELPTGDFPLCIAFDSTGDFATVTNYQAGTYTVMHVAGDSSSVVGTFSSGQYPMRIAYDPANDRMGIGNYGAKTLTLADPRTGALIQNISYAAYGPLADVAFDSDGDPVVLTASVGDFLGHVHHGLDHVALPAVPSEFDFYPATSMCAVSGPGPDYVSLVDFSSQGQAELRKLQAASFKLQATPNPCRSATVLHLTTGSPGRPTASLCLYDSQGRLVRAESEISTPSCPVRFGNLPAGLYFARVSCGTRTAEVRIVLTR